jgi:hypothetical protein
LTSAVDGFSLLLTPVSPAVLAAVLLVSFVNV